MIESAVTDVVRPTVAADEPNALADEIIGETVEMPCFGRLQTSQLTSQHLDALALRDDPGFGVLVCFEQFSDETLAELRREMLDQDAHGVDVSVERETKAKPKLGVVFKQRVGP